MHSKRDLQINTCRPAMPTKKTKYYNTYIRMTDLSDLWTTDDDSQLKKTRNGLEQDKTPPPIKAR